MRSNTQNIKFVCNTSKSYALVTEVENIHVHCVQNTCTVPDIYKVDVIIIGVFLILLQSAWISFHVRLCTITDSINGTPFMYMLTLMKRKCFFCISAECSKSFMCAFSLGLCLLKKLKVIYFVDTADEAKPPQRNKSWVGGS